MKITPVYNIELLAEIAKEKEISCDELRKRHSEEVKSIYDRDINTLLSMGCIICQDEKYVFKYNP